MEIRNRTDRRDLRAALAARDRAWQVGYRGIVDEAVIEAAVADPDEEDLRALEAELDAEAGNFLVAVDETASAAGDDPADGGDTGVDETDGDETDGDDTDGDSATDDAAGQDEDESGSSESFPAVVGYVRVRWGSTSPFVDALETEIVDLYVDPAQWRQGVGTELLDAVTAWSPGMVEGVAVSVLESNDRARAFLESRGFERDGAVVDAAGGEELEHAIYRRPIDRS